MLPSRVALGTMHGKEAVIAPPLRALGIALEVPGSLDTDRFGTFTGETARAGSMKDAAREKALAAMRATGLRFGIASEGSYGPHPQIPLIAAGIEILLWKDDVTGYEIVEQLADETPVFAHVETRNAGDAGGFLERAGFPDTGLIVAPLSCRTSPLAKGIRDRTTLDRLVTEAALASDCGMAFVQTDMRAHMNPRRMKMIGKLAERMAARLAMSCSSCGAPGWGQLRTEPGLPCDWCGGPTLLLKHEIHGCPACGATEEIPRRDGLARADPRYCPACNP
ncbi:DUF6671 family protein [Zhengella sp. ZM62]|uniref:DUF6671 family protein n=1 Tax=Zhengella sedimenti TaxID=3390035 RepID=UPI003975B426